MADTREVVRLTVDGQDGAVVSERATIRVVSNEDQLALIPYAGSLDGNHGRHASPAVAGEPGGTLLVELSESVEAIGRTHAAVVFSSGQQPPASLEVPVGRDLFLTARGGRGQDGNDGGSGTDGMNGDEGMVATRDADATPGTRGGNGGDAGHGTSGASGGDGGRIQVLMSEHNTHLLMAVKWDVSGGDGGGKGHHGKPGKGGIGGPGGKGHTWTETVGYKYYCTESCVGRTEDAPTSGSVSSSRAHMSALFSAVKTQTVHGPDIAAIMARAAAAHGARRNLIADPGNCRCAGGSGNCHGCRYTAINKTFQRAPALRGADGSLGEEATDELISGLPGRLGSFQIHVRDDAGNVQMYDAPYKLELVDFEIDDENGDGVFEPGECVVVRRVRVRNNGGMPSPRCQIQVSILPSADLTPLPSADLFLPPEVPAGGTVTLEGSAAARITQPVETPEMATLYKRSISVAIKAQMPWLNRDLPDFNVTQSFTTEYPYELRDLSCLSSLTYGASGRIAWQVYNKSNLPIMPDDLENERTLEVQVSFPTEYGFLQPHDHYQDTNQDGGDESNNGIEILEVPGMGTKQSSNMYQVFTTSLTPQDHSRARIELVLYLDDPNHEGEGEGDEGATRMIAIQRQTVEIQISRSHVFSDNAAFLILSNSSASQSWMRAIQNFITMELHMVVDIWNVNLYGGLKYLPSAEEMRAENDSDHHIKHIFQKYRGKSIIVLGNKFGFFDLRETSFFQLLDPRIVAEEALLGTSFLFLGTSEHDAFAQFSRFVMHPLPGDIASDSMHQPKVDSYHRLKDVIASVAEEKLRGSEHSVFLTSYMQPRWYRLWHFDTASEARRATSSLSAYLPQFGAIVSVLNQPEQVTQANEDVIPSSNKGGRFLSSLNLRSKAKVKARQSRLLISPGQSQNTYLAAVSSSASLKRGHSSSLTKFEQYQIVMSLSTALKIAILWPDNGDSERLLNGTMSQALMDITASSLMVSIVAEITRYLDTSFLPRSKYSENTGKPNSSQLLRLQIPTLATLLYCPAALRKVTESIPRTVMDILKQSLACCKPQKKRQILPNATIPFVMRRNYLRSALHQEIKKLLECKGYPLETVKQWHNDVKVSHSIKTRQQRDVYEKIMRQAAEHTDVSSHDFKAWRWTSSDLVSTVRYVSPADWTRQYSDVNTMVDEINRRESSAQDTLQKMLVNEPTIDLSSDAVAELADTSLQNAADASPQSAVETAPHIAIAL